MDLVYRSARKVVIALEDIALSTTDADSMFMYANKNASNRQISEIDRENLASAFVKIAAARWFDRAWCLHEFLVSRHHVFLVPIWHVDGPALSKSSSTTILRIDGPFLVQMYHIFIEQDIKHQNSGQQSILNSRRFTGIEIFKIRRFFTRLRALDLHGIFASEEKPLEDGSFMHMFYEVFSHGAFHTADKVSINLNTMRSGLYLKVPTSFSEDEYLFLITLVAMAAGDTTALTTNGPRSLGGGGKLGKHRQWMRAPSHGDQARRTGALTIPRTRIDVKVVEDGLELEVLFLGTNAVLTSPSQHYLSIARWLIDHRSLCEKSLDDQELRIDTEADETIYAKLRISYIQTLACALACGMDWMLDYHAKSYVSLPDGLSLQWNPSSRETFRQAVDWGLATVIEQDIGPDLREMWQDGGTLMWADDDTQMQEEDVTQTQEEDASLDFAGESHIQVNQEEQVWYNILLDFTETLVNFGLAIFPESTGSEDGQEVWSVQIWNTSEVSKSLVYAPAAGTQEQFYLAIPKALWDDAYSWMSRIWLLQEHKSSTLSQHYSLRGKSRLASISPLPDPPGMRVTISEDERGVDGVTP